MIRSKYFQYRDDLVKMLNTLQWEVVSICSAPPEGFILFYRETSPSLEELRFQKKEIEKRCQEEYRKVFQNSETFLEKLKLWNSTEWGKKISFLPSPREFPRLREWIDSREFHRYRRYDLRELFEEEILILLGEYEGEVSPQKRVILEEVVEKELIEFEFDW